MFIVSQAAILIYVNLHLRVYNTFINLIDAYAAISPLHSLSLVII